MLFLLLSCPPRICPFVLSRVSRGRLVSTILKKPLFWYPGASYLLLLKNQSHDSGLKYPAWSVTPPPLSVHLLLLFLLICSTPAILASLLYLGFCPFVRAFCSFFSLPAVLFPRILVCTFPSLLMSLLKCHILNIKNMVNNIGYYMGIIWVQMVTRVIVVIISQCMQMSDHFVVHLKLT